MSERADRTSNKPNFPSLQQKLTPQIRHQHIHKYFQSMQSVLYFKASIGNLNLIKSERWHSFHNNFLMIFYFGIS